jgi:hypothetical protein
MNSLLPVLVLLFVALLGARVSFSTKSARMGPRLLLRTGMQFLIVGFVLGPSGLNLLTREATQGLFPFLALGLGWVGFHFGLQLERESLRLFPARHFVIAIGQAVLVFVLFSGGALAASRVMGFDDSLVPLLVLGAACTAAVTTPAGIAVVSSNFLVRGKVRDLLFFIGSLDALVGITALQVTYSLYRPASALEGVGGLDELRWVGAALGVGLICGIVFIWLTRRRPSSEELVLYLLGISAFAAGVALQWGLSPLFVGVTMGAVVANLGASGRRILPVLERWEKMVYVTFLLLAGALLQIPTWAVLPVALGYALLRFTAKVLSASIMVTLVPLSFRAPRGLGFGLIPQGGISIAMAVSGVLMYSDLQIRGFDAEAALFAVIVIGVVLSELAGPVLAKSVLERAGEISPEVLEAIAHGDDKQARREALARPSGEEEDAESADH